MSDLLTNFDVILETEQDDFTFIGPGDAAQIASTLGQNVNNNIIYVGRSGVGKTANLFGLAQAQNEDPETTKISLPLHMISREFFLMDVGKTFAGSEEEIRANVKEIFSELKKPGCNVLVIEDANDFLTAILDHNVHGIIPSLMAELRKGSFQCIWMVREKPGNESNLSDVLGCHSDVEELFTVLEKEPAEHDTIIDIVKSRSRVLENHHKNLLIDEDAVVEVVELTLAYPSLSIYQREQPARAIRMLDSIASRFITKVTQDNSTAESWKESVRKLQALNKEKNEAEAFKAKHEALYDEATEQVKERLRIDLEREPDNYDMDIAKSTAMREAAESIHAAEKELERIYPEIQKVKNANPQ